MIIAQQETAIDAFHAHQSSGMSSQQRSRILAHIQKHGGDWSIGEIAHALRMEKSTVSARINELLNDTAEVIAKQKRKDRISGVLIRPVCLPAIQMEIFQ